jgi:predicted transcriptional regulator
MTSPLITINSDLVSSVAVDMTLQNYVRHLLLVDSQNNANEPIGIITPLDFTRYQEYANDDDKKKDSIEKILEYYI